ncbi:MAG TPA: hypothetical protein VFL83_03435 [Anaeromyxobacter sp.]|nr:hypothetical protein [Anaeromyxobacter sp.]
MGGRVVGTWTRRLERGAVAVTPTWFERAQGGAGALGRAVARYGRFLALEARPRAASGERMRRGRVP